MKLTRKQAFDLSIRKWEALAKGEPVPEDIENMDLVFGCGLCEKFKTEDEKYPCLKCPIRPDLKNYKIITESGCRQRKHPFNDWVRYKTLEDAQKVLDLILACRNKRRR